MCVVNDSRSIALEMEKIYRENGRSLVNEILLEKLLQTTCHPRQVMAPLIKVGGALVAALYHSVGSEVGGFFVEKLVRKLMDSVEKEKNSSARMQVLNMARTKMATAEPPRSL